MAKRRAKDKGKEKIVEELRATKPDPEHLSWILAERWAKDKGKLKIEESVTTNPDSEHEGFIEATPVSSWPFIPPNMESNVGIELPPNAKLLMDLEAADILQRVQKYLRSLNDPRLKIPQALVSALQYLQDVVRYVDVTTVIRSLVGLKECNGATDWEICMIANICPKTVEEAYALIPSLKAKKDQIDEALDILLLTLALMKEKDFVFLH